VIAAFSTGAAFAAMNATATTPIVFLTATIRYALALSQT
jgi:ABC-type uncharacterized transport system substrate-binding protein